MSSSSSLDFLARRAAQAATLSETEHRPWPPPTSPWMMAQTWDDLLFAHSKRQDVVFWPLAPVRAR